jgi:hypothetical protein
MNLKIIKQSKKYLVVSKSGNTSEGCEIIRTLVTKSPKLIAFIGKDCAELEEICDEYCVGDGSQPVEGIVTTSHPNESLNEVTDFVERWELDSIGKAFELVEI